MIHIANNPEEPMDDWNSHCSTVGLHPAIRFTPLVKDLEAAKAIEDEQGPICWDCLNVATRETNDDC